MTFKAKLFDLICRANDIVVAGFDMDEFRSSADETIQYVACGDTVEFGFTDQEVEVDNGGETGYIVPVSIVADDEGLFGDLEPVRFWFRVRRPITQEDLT